MPRLSCEALSQKAKEKREKEKDANYTTIHASMFSVSESPEHKPSSVKDKLCAHPVLVNAQSTSH